MDLKFISDFSLVEDQLKDEAFSSITLNPTLKWMKFILTDDQPNGNKQRVPKEEFENLIKSGINMPIKMAFGTIKEGHDDSFPIGVITHLKEVGNKIEGLAALWYKERKEDVEFLRSMFDQGSTPQVSWEIPYENSEIVDGIETLRGTALRAATIVGMPAYAGRTPIIAMASTKVGTIVEKIDKQEELTKEEFEALDDYYTKARKLSSESSLEDLKNMEELEKVQKDLAEAQDRVKELEAELRSETDAKAAIEKEKQDLAEYKEAVEAEKARGKKLESIRTKFTDAGIKKDDEYFESNEDMLLGMDDTALEFMIQEWVAFASASSNDEEEEDDDKESNSSRIPNFSASKNSFNIKEAAEALRARHK